MRKIVVIFGVFFLVAAAMLYSVKVPGAIFQHPTTGEWLEIGSRPLGGYALVVGFFGAVIIVVGYLLNSNEKQ